MRLGFHPLVQRDVDQAVQYLEDNASPKLAAEFYDGLIALFQRVAAQPTRYHKWRGVFRRANYKRFNYHFLYVIRRTSVHVIVVRHDKRHPAYGLNIL
jgi:plasmid stabilization system protein ParE